MDQDDCSHNVYYCNDCANIFSFECYECGDRYIRTNNRKNTFNDIELCNHCYIIHTKRCDCCGKRDYKLNCSEVFKGYRRLTLCSRCTSLNCFTCEICEREYSNEYKAEYIHNGKIICVDCYDELYHKCDGCGKSFEVSKVKTFWNITGFASVCEACNRHKTFMCSVCKRKTLISDRLESQFIPKSRNVCKRCGIKCNKCDTFIDPAIAVTLHEKKYCSNCIDEYAIKCSICGESFIPQEKEADKCEKCIETLNYIKRLKSISQLDGYFKEYMHHELEVIDRCQLFTDLVDGNRSYKPITLSNGDLKFLEYIVIDILGKEVVITYLPSNIIGNMKSSLDFTMTEFRRKYNRNFIYKTLCKRLNESENKMETSAGEIIILNNPIKLRVQTQYDKIYGKEWNGPYDYIEIGNYGDTHSFYIIGAFL